MNVALTQKPITIVMADDDPDDRMLMKKAMAHTQKPHDIQFVENGVDLLDYLRNQGVYKEKKNHKPGLVLLDLNMPKMDGREALRLIKTDPELRSIPVIILTTSKAEEDILETYDQGANSFICKPVRFQELVNLVLGIENYWLETVLLPVRY